MSFWTDKRVIVTGGAGFLGRSIVRKLEERGCSQVTVPRSREYDLRLKEDVRILLEDNPPDLVIHAAGTVGGIGATQARPGTFFYDNLVMGAHLLEECRLREIPKFVGVGTVCSYPKYAPVPFKEEDFWDGYPEETNAPYGLAKKMMTVQSQAYREEFGYNSIMLLLVNLFGPGDDFEPESSHVIPALIRKCLEANESGHDEITVWGDGSSTREFVYVDDAAEGILLAAERYDISELVNIGSGEDISILELTEKIRELTGFRGKFRWDRTKPNGQPKRLLDVSRARERFGFKATVSLDEGLRRTIKWYKEETVAASN